MVPDEDVLREVRDAGLNPMSGLRGIGYGVRQLLPLFVTCETLDFSHTVGCVNSPWQSTFIYERYPLGLGFTERAYERLHEILPALLERIKTCTCRDGCPCCVGKPLRGDATWNVERHEGSVPSKRSARRILELLLADGSRLDLPDEESLGQPDEEARLRLEQSLRRRLERQAFPSIFHEIDPLPPEGYPEPEPLPQSLSDTDVARRAIRRREHEKQQELEAYREAQRREAVKAEGANTLSRGVSSERPGPEEGLRGGRPATDPVQAALRKLDRLAPQAPPPVSAPPPAPETPAEAPVVPTEETVASAAPPPSRLLGDAVAAAARRKRRGKKQE